MSYSEGCGSPKDYGEILEYDDTSLIIGDAVGPTKSQRVQATERLSSSRYPSEMSMDLSELQIEEGSSSRLVSGSSKSNNSSSDEPLSPRRQRQRMSEDDSKKKSDDDDDSGYGSYRSGSRGANSSVLKFDEIPEDFFHQSDMSDFTSFYTDSFRHENRHSLTIDNRHSLTTVDEQGDTESENSISASSLANPQSRRNSLQSSNGSMNGRRKVKFEISTRLEDIQEYAKPDVEDYHMLYYTSHELQKMIDGQKEEERKERNSARQMNKEQSDSSPS